MKMKNDKESPKDYISLRQLSKEIFTEGNEDYYYKKTLDNFKYYCYSMGLDLERFKGARDYKIPLRTKYNWMMIIKYISMASKKPKEKEVVRFSDELFKKHKELYSTFMNPEYDLTNEKGDFLADQVASIGEMYYNFDVMSYELESEAHSNIENDFEYIRKNSPQDRIVLYSELYCDYLRDVRKNIQEIIENNMKEK